MSGEGPELVFGLVGACGTDLRDIGDRIERELRRVSYSATRIRLSDSLLGCFRFAALRRAPPWPEDERLTELMDAGDALRRAANRGDAVALLGIRDIALKRTQIARAAGDRSDKVPTLARHAHIIHSLKTPDEISTLRDVYGSAFFAIAVYLPKGARVKRLAKRIRDTRDILRSEGYEEEARRLIDRDEKEDGDEFGQSVRDAFPECDVFLDASDDDALTRQIARFVDILFSHPFRTPTQEEYGLFHARAAALRSADLSRQVGAVIANTDGDILVAGCNEVPKFGGGAVWEGSDAGPPSDIRDFHLGFDSSARMKKEILEEIFGRLKDAGWLSERLQGQSVEQMFDAALFHKDGAILKGTRAASIIEFGRIVHAEMSAITSAARLGVSVRGATLYCTTFPCHMCARHIVAAGLSTVVYVEPYPKSMAGELYEGVINVDHSAAPCSETVNFRPFVGVAPRRYLEFFDMVRRKDALGRAVKWDPDRANPRVMQSATFRDTETAFEAELSMNKHAWGIEEPSPENEEEP
ncbi:cytidine deaminase [Roseomonas sp. JC162]|uniref:Cytidine deaminase n=1 Tax=Neoroseomonas marina TaxID=1232220 RepID=A0A848EFI2_9PROT|nr:anti-phage dCTP deaminase [Neoroseomonas marina]NMJ42812.1 cytidine deaminase [Neoroseomonas marina]